MVVDVLAAAGGAHKAVRQIADDVAELVDRIDLVRRPELRHVDEELSDAATGAAQDVIKSDTARQLLLLLLMMMMRLGLSQSSPRLTDCSLCKTIAHSSDTSVISADRLKSII